MCFGVEMCKDFCYKFKYIYFYIAQKITGTHQMFWFRCCQILNAPPE